MRRRMIVLLVVMLVSGVLMGMSRPRGYWIEVIREKGVKGR